MTGKWCILKRFTTHGRSLSFGASDKRRRSCGLSTIGSTSFFPSKPLGCYGNGCALFTNDDNIAKAMREISIHGRDRSYHHPRIGARYIELLQNHAVTPCIAPENTSVYAQYTVRVENRDDFQKKLGEQSISTAVHYPVPLHLQPVFSHLGYEEGSVPVAETAAKRVTSLPMHPYITEGEIVSIASEVVGLKCH